MQTITKSDTKGLTLVLAVLFLLTLFAPLPYFMAKPSGEEIIGNGKTNVAEELIPGEDNDSINDPVSGETDIETDNEIPVGEIGEEDETIIEEEPPLIFTYPDAVRGIYVTGNTVGVARFNRLLDLVNSTDLNAMVIDIKDDWGYITYKLNGTQFDDISKNYIKDPEELMQTLAEHNIYPIARIVVFKDTVLANKKPEYSFTANGNVWLNNRKEAFVSPFLPEVWEYNLEIAKKAAELGFQEIQFDYVRFPEGFEKRDRSLSYSFGDYTEEKLKPRIIKEWEEQPEDKRTPEPPSYSFGLARIMAVTDFVEYAKKELEPYGVQVSVDIFGYTATIPQSLGIGQNFLKISQHVDVISSMIYPSHWGPNYFGIPKPDREPYLLVKEYAKMENELLTQLDNPPVSRPWIQDFTASWLGSGNYIPYGKAEVEAQIRALNEEGIKEFLIWNASNSYAQGVNYKPLD